MVEAEKSLSQFEINDASRDLALSHLNDRSARNILKERQRFRRSLRGVDKPLKDPRGHRKHCGCFPAKGHKFYTVLFYVVFFVIYLTNVFIINPKLNVWYFVLSTTTISLKLFLTYISAHKTNPGYLEKSSDLEWQDVLKVVPQTRICPKCKVVRTEETVHCPVVNKCIDRYDQFSWWSNAPVGRGNHGFYFAFIFFFWLDVFLVGWIDAKSITVTECDLPDGQICPLDFLCLG